MAKDDKPESNGRTTRIIISIAVALSIGAVGGVLNNWRTQSVILGDLNTIKVSQAKLETEKEGLERGQQDIEKSIVGIEKDVESIEKEQKHQRRILERIDRKIP